MPAGRRALRLTGQAGLLVLLAATALSGKSDVPLPSACEQAEPTPFPPPDQAPWTRVWKSESDGLPAGAACMPQGPAGSQLWVSVAGSSHDTKGPESLLARFGQISQMRQIKYWSISDHRWRPLFSSASALTAAAGAERDDFSLAELERGAPVYLEQADSRSSRKVIYEMRLERSSRQGFVLSTVNVSAVQWWGMTVYKPGDLDTRYFLRRTAGDEWHFYSLARMPAANRLFSAQDGSYVNRAVAMYRFLVGIPTDSEPPAVP